MHFLSMAKGSVGEVGRPLYVAFDQSYLEEKICNDWLPWPRSRLLAGLMKYLSGTEYKGAKYK